MEKEEYKYSDITRKIIGAAMEVHKFLGNGFQEVIYQRALVYELKQAELNFVREIEQDIYYKELTESSVNDFALTESVARFKNRVTVQYPTFAVLSNRAFSKGFYI